MVEDARAVLGLTPEKVKVPLKRLTLEGTKNLQRKYAVVATKISKKLPKGVFDKVSFSTLYVSVSDI